MCVRSPVNSSGERTSISLPARPHVRAHVVHEGADARVVALRRRVRATAGASARRVVISRPSASHFARPPSRMRAFVKPNSWNTQSAYVAHQLFLSP